MSCCFLCFHLDGSGVPVTSTCHCCAVGFLRSRRMRRSLHILRCVRPLRLMAQLSLPVCRRTAACSPQTDFPGGGDIHDHIPFQSSRGEIYQTQNFLPQASKTFASAPGQLPRDVVSVPRRKGPLRGNPRRPGRQKELRSSRK
ncbi:hypothetical protein FM737_004443 [Escherichia marmotae]|nr:hypothetical protein FM737_004443 [Escherichia marmotae]